MTHGPKTPSSSLSLTQLIRAAITHGAKTTNNTAYRCIREQWVSKCTAFTTIITKGWLLLAHNHKHKPTYVD